MARITEILVNGKRHAIDADAEATLLSVLRDELGLTGTKFGCGEGQCRACTVLLDGKPVHSCMTPLGEAANKQITTIEGLATDGRLHPVQQAFLDAEAFQCGYCTPGFIMAGAELLDEIPQPTNYQIQQSISGNLCRCTGYYNIVSAIRKAAMEKERVSE